VPNRAFLRGKAIAAIVMFATITTLFASLVIGALGVEIVKRYAPGFAGNNIAAYVLSIAVSVPGRVRLRARRVSTFDER